MSLYSTTSLTLHDTSRVRIDRIIESLSMDELKRELIVEITQHSLIP
jgi:hypothetical protein